MGTLNAFYVRRSADVVVSAVRATFPTAEIETTSEFIGAILANDADTPEQDLMELSSRLKTDVMWLSFQSATDAFEYYHWHAGALLRALVYGCYTQERTWERIEGQPEAREQAAFFDPEDLDFILEDEEDDEERQKLERFWQAGELVVGRMEPYLSARECARQVATYYRFPGWRL
jgi:hypothetical protein